MTIRLFALIVAAGCSVASTSLTTGCASGGGRPESSEARRYLSFTDVKRAIRTASADGLARPWRENFRNTQGREPAILLYRIKNNSDARDITETMLGNQIEEEFLNSGVVVLTERSEVVQSARDTRRNDEYTDPEFLKKLKSERIGDFYLTFTLDSMRDAGEKGYQMTFELISLDTTQKVWIKTYDVLK
ncbi:MAG: hypothetical protein AB7G11_05645 [Phycisphaerales bacterium]